MIERYGKIILALIAVVWIGTASWLHHDNRSLRKRIEEKSELVKKYKNLKSRWSEAARRKTFRSFLKTLDLRHIDYRLEKTPALLRLKMDLNLHQADPVLNRLFQLPLDFGKIVLKSQNNKLEAVVEIKR